ncbi:major facilitator superfamily domain-containing protein [Colletotrichum lupini]|nr:major facilitator superfamily domain-containing protein [Colletotrichum lupini]
MAPPSKLHRAGILVMPASVSLLNTFNSGLLTVAPPAIARELDIAPSVQQWPASVYALGLSCGLLPLGAIADVVGNRPVFLTGLLLYTVFTLAVSLSRTGGELIAFRTGASLPAGRTRNVAFALASPWGPVLGGVFVQAASWRAGYWMSTSVNAVFMILAFFCLPKLTNGVASFVRRPHSIALSIVAGLLVPFYVFWESRQERLGRPAVLPNSIWHRLEFATACLSVLLTWSWFNAFSYWATLYYQESQQLDALQTAVRFLPVVVSGLVDAGMLSLIGGIMSIAAPLIFALQDVLWIVISTDLLFNISNLVITNNFPSKSQALAGGVFNTVAHIGLAVTAMIAASGYWSRFWTCFAAAVVVTLISSTGLRKAGKVGEKKEV